MGQPSVPLRYRRRTDPGSAGIPGAADYRRQYSRRTKLGDHSMKAERRSSEAGRAKDDVVGRQRRFPREQHQLQRSVLRLDQQPRRLALCLPRPLLVPCERPRSSRAVAPGGEARHTRRGEALDRICRALERPQRALDGIRQRASSRSAVEEPPEDQPCIVVAISGGGDVERGERPDRDRISTRRASVPPDSLSARRRRCR